MTAFFGYKRLTRPDDWRGLAGDDKWRPGCSAYELAHVWQAAGGLPREIRKALDRSGFEQLEGLEIDLCLVEKPVFLDTRVAPSMTDVMAYGHNAAGQPLVMAVEGKADEVFASRICDWIRGDQSPADLCAPPRLSRVRRLRFLSKHLGKPLDDRCRLRYQLLHRTVSAILEAQLNGGAVALVLIHAFGAEAPDNWRDFLEFLEALGGGAPAKQQVAGPYALGETSDVPTYFFWWQHRTL